MGHRWEVYGEALEWRDGEVYRLGCCDCGLVHEFSVIVKGKRAIIGVARDNRATAQFRRHRKYPFWKPKQTAGL